MVIDDEGNAYVSGSFSHTVDFDPSASEHSLTAYGLSDVFVSSYDNLGGLRWAFQIGGHDATGRLVQKSRSGPILAGHDRIIPITLAGHSSGLYLYRLSASAPNGETGVRGSMILAR